MRRGWRGWLALLLLASCGRDEVRRLAEVQTELDRLLVAKKTAANNLTADHQRRTELDALVVKCTHANLGASPAALLQRGLMGTGSRELDPNRRSFEISGVVQAGVVVSLLEALGRIEPGLRLTHLSVLPTGWTVRLAMPVLPPPLPPPAPYAPAVLPPLPIPGTFTTSDAKRLRVSIARTFEEIAQIDQVLAQQPAEEVARRYDADVLREAEVGERLPNAVESASVFLVGYPAWFTVAELDFHGDEVTLSGPDPGPGPDPRREHEALRRLFAEPHIERSDGQLVMHLTRLGSSFPDRPPAPTVSIPSRPR